MKKSSFNARLIQKRGKSCGRIGYFMTSIVPGQDTRRAFFPVGSRSDDIKAIAFRSEHRERIHGPVNF